MFACPHCNAKYPHIPASQSGRMARCKFCSNTFLLTPVAEQVEPPRPRTAAPDTFVAENSQPDQEADTLILSGPTLNPQDSNGDTSAVVTATATTEDSSYSEGYQEESWDNDPEGSNPQDPPYKIPPRKAPGVEDCVTLGFCSIILFPFAPLFSIMAITKANACLRMISRSRGLLTGSHQARTGLMLGWTGFIIFLMAAILGALYLKNHPETLEIERKQRSRGEMIYGK